MESSEEVRNWLDLPGDVLSLVFSKLGVFDVLFNVQNVCSSWRKFCKEPLVWLAIDLRYPWPDMDIDLEKVARHAIDRSCGQLVEFSVDYICTDELLRYITERSCPLRCLRLMSCHRVTDDGLIEVVNGLPLLEELDLSYCCTFSNKVLEVIGCSCPHLKTFKLNSRRFRNSDVEWDEEAFTIAGCMPELRNLQLLGNQLTDDGLRAILDGCPHLESLDLRQCFNVNLGGELQKRCADAIRCLSLPNDFDYCEIDPNAHGYETVDEDYPSGFSEVDFLSDDVYYEFSDGNDLSDYGEFVF
ncbi:PREDICTED: F-box protein SKIP19 [Nelumbo nucifera]|uniref:F-box domain-containing protein n=2 Tax=Nelumbo nucifera TaxID=4432 RepID=A0A822YXI5_NELNU|nr:PREDICTED: F-box protein SKIP19 [Nelumbo nucifera]DAD37257.1 TPA_asm: hypothetical protein HUJ06_007898 [Nelumbo nucifera]